MSYLPLTHFRLRQATRLLANRLKDLDFDSIVFRGLSGALVAPLLAVRLKKNLVAIRKGETSHGNPIEVRYGEAPKRYVIVDDFIDSGTTISEIKHRMNVAYPSAKAVAIALYNATSSNKRHEKWENVPLIAEEVTL